MENITDILCDLAFDMKYDLFPETTIIQTKKFIVDYFSACFAGYKVNKIFNASVWSVLKSFGGVHQASVFLELRKYPVPVAAFVNAMYAHGADMDDGNRLSAGHIGTHVMSSVFALAEARKLQWKDVIVAINVGYEFFNRIGCAAQPSLYNKGFHSTGVIGSIASAAACAKLLGLNKKQIYNSVSLAAIQSGGLIIIDESGQGCKPINPANAAKIGILSALISEKGIDAPLCPLESQKGWFHAFAENIDLTKSLQNLGTTFTIDESYLKIYPTCRHTHSCIDAAVEIYKKLYTDEKKNKVKKIYVYTYPSAIKSAGMIIYPKTKEEAKFSITYATVIALTKGMFKLDDLEPDNISNEAFEMIKKIELISDSSMENRILGIRGARMKVILEDDSVIEKTVFTPKGEGKDTLAWEDLEKKLYSCAEGIIPTSQVSQLLEQCKKMDKDSIFSYPVQLLE